MCYALSFVVLADRRVYSPTSLSSNSHSTIISRNTLNESFLGNSLSRIEIFPGSSSGKRIWGTREVVSSVWFTKPETWNIRWDDGGRASGPHGGACAPSWWSGAHERALFAAVRKWQKMARKHNARIAAPKPASLTPAQALKANALKQAATLLRRAVTQYTAARSSTQTTLKVKSAKDIAKVKGNIKKDVTVLRNSMAAIAKTLSKVQPLV